MCSPTDILIVQKEFVFEFTPRLRQKSNICVYSSGKLLWIQLRCHCLRMRTYDSIHNFVYTLHATRATNLPLGQQICLSRHSLRIYSPTDILDVQKPLCLNSHNVCGENREYTRIHREICYRFNSHVNVSA